MKSLFAGLACCGLGLSLNAPIGVATEWKPVNTDAKSKSTTNNQVEKVRSTQWSPVQSKPGTSTKTNRQVVWTPVEPSTELAPSQPNWAAVDTETKDKEKIQLKLIEPAIAQEIEKDIENEEPVKNASANDLAIKTKVIQTSDEQANSSEGLRWPNGQHMSKEDQIYFRTAYSRGSMIQIGETVYPNLGYNALQRKPGSWINIQLSAIDDSLMVSPSPCEDGNFLDQCADGLMTNWIRLWADQNFSAELQWTIHSLSGEGAPYDFSTDQATFGSNDTGTKFGEGQSLGLKLSKNFGKTFGLSIGADRLIHLDKTTDLPKNISIMGTKVFRLNDKIDPPILSVTAGLMSDTYNPMFNIGTVKYPKSIRGGQYPSIFSAAFDEFLDGKYSRNAAGASSAFVCAERSIFAGKSLSSVSESCLKEVFVGPVGSIGFAPWPWIGTYAIYNGWDLNLGVSFKPFKEIDWTFSFELVGPIVGVNPGTDRHINFSTCPEDNYSFSACRTRLGIFTDISF